MNNRKIRKRSLITGIYLFLETILYAIIITQRGELQVAASYISILCCFAYLLINIRQCDGFILGASACTVMADYFLVVHSPIQRLWGMVFFLGAQTLYALRLHFWQRNKLLLILGFVLIGAALGITVVILREKTDALALISLCYYANLAMNIVVAFTKWKSCKLLCIGFVLFLLCDTVIGLQVASGAYLPIAEGSWLHNVLFMNFPLAWFFYLPSQVLLALSGVKNSART
ncbi:MAG: hypothetical protein IJ351_06160 [Oscillospiraceae bacterium]|nr:hypothetical protein [Oscillospiraceae bacterium]